MVPSLFTTMNLAAGFYCVVAASEGHLGRGAVALTLAIVFDILDGRVARLAHAESRFGSEYDSIADTVSFGVAPAMLAFNAGAFRELGWTGWVMSFMFMAGAALRLARFNVTPARYRGRFEGLPSPAAAGMVLSTVLFVNFLRESGADFSLPASLPAFGLAALGLLMVSPIPYRSFKELRLGGSYRSVVFMVFALLIVLSKPEVTLFVFGMCYVSSGPIGWFMRMRSGKTLEEVPAEPTASDERAAAPSSAGDSAAPEATS
jgi:CDP-diacylglycerol--serine O-phosphatidyltransferase